MLVCTQVLGGVGVSIGLAVSTLAAARMSGSDAIGGSALTCAVLGAAGAAVLVARIATRAGRRPSLTTGYLIGAVGAAVAVLAAELGLWPLLLAGLVLLGRGHRGRAGRPVRRDRPGRSGPSGPGAGHGGVGDHRRCGGRAEPGRSRRSGWPGRSAWPRWPGRSWAARLVFALAALLDLDRPAPGSAAAGPAGRDRCR